MTAFPSVALAVAASLAAPGATAPVIELAEVEAAIHRSAGYLKRAALPDGSFVYRIHLDPGVNVEPRYNLLRHAGTIYALAAYERRYPDPATRATIERAAGFLEREGIGPVPAGEGMLAVWERSEITGVTMAPRAKLGGAGLALVALVSAREVGAATTPIEDLRALGRFVLFMQNADGSFHSIYTPEGGRSNEWRSLYYPGEAALGLVLLHGVDPAPAWLDGAVRALGHLAATRAGAAEVEADHWALVATAKLLERLPREAPRAALLAHATQIVRSILDSLPAAGPMAVASAGHLGDGRTCPTATRVEGLLAALEILPEQEQALRERIVVALDPAVAFLVGAQLASGEHAGAMPSAAILGPGGGERTGEVQIDYVQHALSALLGYGGEIRRGGKGNAEAEGGRPAARGDRPPFPED